MSDNKSKREELEKIYGSDSMFQKSRAEDYISSLTIEIPVHTYHRKIDLRKAEERRRRQEKRDFNRLRKELEDR